MMKAPKEEEQSNEPAIGVGGTQSCICDLKHSTCHLAVVQPQIDQKRTLPTGPPKWQSKRILQATLEGDMLVECTCR